MTDSQARGGKDVENKASNLPTKSISIDNIPSARHDCLIHYNHHGSLSASEASSSPTSYSEIAPDENMHDKGQMNQPIEKRPKWERFRGLSVGEFLREIEFEKDYELDDFDDDTPDSDDELLKISMKSLGPIEEDDEDSNSSQDDGFCA